MEVHENNAANMNDDNNAAAEAAEDEEAEEENEDEIEVVTVNNAADFKRIRNTYNGTGRGIGGIGLNTPLFYVIIGPTITEIPNAAFRYCATLIEVAMAVSSDDDRTRSIIRRIERGAFRGCKKLRRINGLLHSGLLRIGFGAFKECAIEPVRTDR